MNNQRPFEGLTALITGASSGIGAGTAVAMARQGASVIFHYNAKHAEAAEVLERVRGEGAEGELVQADLSTSKGTRELASFAEGRRIDILINNAGSLLARTRILDLERSDCVSL